MVPMLIVLIAFSHCPKDPGVIASRLAHDDLVRGRVQLAKVQGIRKWLWRKKLALGGVRKDAVGGFPARSQNVPLKLAIFKILHR